VTIAAQSIVSQEASLPMRTFHTGELLGLILPQGLPRIPEILKLRHPKGDNRLITEVTGECLSIDENLLTVLKKLLLKVKQNTSELSSSIYVLRESC